MSLNWSGMQYMNKEWKMKISRPNDTTQVFVVDDNEYTLGEFEGNRLCKNIKSSVNIQNPQKLPSLRPTCSDDDEKHNFFHTTPEIRRLVGTHLSSILDNILSKRLTKKTTKDIKRKRKKILGGVKLLNESLDCLVIEKGDGIIKSQCFKRKIITDPDPSLELKCKEVAVNPQDILSGNNDVKFWSNRSKAVLLRYRSTSEGLLELIESSEQQS